MHLSCPQCQTSYEVENTSDNTSVVCHRCGYEFAISFRQEGPSSARPVETAGGTGRREPEEGAGLVPPRRKKARLWTWLVVMLLLIGSGGFWQQRDMWLDNRWVRSTAINLGVPVTLRDRDWSIEPESVQAEWVSREDGSRVLVIRGRVKNLLSSELPLPLVEISFFSLARPDRSIAGKRQQITLQPARSAIRQVPYATPLPDTTPVAPLGARDFVLVIESLPEDTGDFTLTARIR